MNKTPAAQLIAQFKAAPAVRIGDMIKRAEQHEQTAVSLEQCTNRLTTAVDMAAAAHRRFYELCTVPAVAVGMAEKLQNMQELWHVKIKHMPRADRRAYRRAFIQELKKFKEFCADNGITYTIQ